jgi:hypothetical protein
MESPESVVVIKGPVVWKATWCAEHEPHVFGSVRLRKVGRALVELGLILVRDEHAELEATRQWLDGMGFRFDRRYGRGGSPATAQRVVKARRITEVWRRRTP